MICDRRNWNHIPWSSDVLLKNDVYGDDCIVYSYPDIKNFKFSSQNFSKIFFEFAYDPFPELSQTKKEVINEIVSSHPKFQWRILSSEFTSEFPVVYVPIFLLSQNLYRPQKDFKHNRQYIFSCLNGGPKWFRVVLADFLIKEIKRKSLTTLHVPNDYEMLLSECENNDKSISRRDLISTFELFKNSSSDYRPNDHSIDHDAYQDSYVNIVTETSMDGSFLSEKICKPIRSQQFFIVVGPQNTIAHLRDLGIDVFDDIFQNHYYDTEPNWNTRIEKIKQLIKTVEPFHWENLYLTNLHRLNNNLVKFHSKSFRNQLMNPFLTAFED